MSDIQLINQFQPVTTETKNPILSKEEMDLLSGAIERTLSSFERKLTHGTIILDGQRDEEKSVLLYKCNLQGGAFDAPIVGKKSCSSDALAATAIDEMLELEDRSCYRHSFILNAKNVKEAVRSGIYHHEEHMVMVMNATGGRFLCSVYLCAQDDETWETSRDESMVTLAVIATVLEQMFPGDYVLQRSMNEEFFGTMTRTGVVARMSPWQFISNAKQYCGSIHDETVARWRRWYETKGIQARREGLFGSANVR